MSEELLNIVDVNDIVVGTASRNDIHAEGLLHREVGVLFVTPAADIIFQRRSLKKASNPGKLAFTVAGHVSAGETYEDAVIKEIAEETGLQLSLSDLHLLNRDRTKGENGNHCFRNQYGYIYTGLLENLKVEPGEGDGFVAIAGQDVLKLPEHIREDIATNLLDPVIYGHIYKKLLALVE
jgi:isopentenyldiphosphate isomerase